MVTTAIVCSVFALRRGQTIVTLCQERVPMRVLSGSTILSAAAVVLVSGCATSGALRRATEQQQAALAAQKSVSDAALATERSERAAQDSALSRDLGQVRGDIQALR